MAMTKTKSRQKWTNQEIKRLQGLKTGRTTVPQLSQSMGRSQGAIRQQCMTQGISTKSATGRAGRGTQQGSFRTAASSQRASKKTSSAKQRKGTG